MPNLMTRHAHDGLPLLVGLLLAILCTPSASGQNRSYHFDIPGETLSEALRAYGRAAGQQIIFTEDVVTGIRVAPLRGDYLPEVALERLLEGTGLTAERSPSGVVMIRRRTVAPAQSTNAQPTAKETSPTPTAQLNQTAPIGSSVENQDAKQASKQKRV